MTTTVLLWGDPAVDVASPLYGLFLERGPLRVLLPSFLNEADALAGFPFRDACQADEVTIEGRFVPFAFGKYHEIALLGSLLEHDHVDVMLLFTRKDYGPDLAVHAEMRQVDVAIVPVAERTL